jgi:aspartyl-tRNA(Asn)/glutamyl-tRNA(Gln) amidotransferase subunit A
MNYKTIKAAQEAIKKGETSCAALVEFHLAEIQRYSNHNIFLEVFQADARGRATVVDEKIKHGTAGRLAGAVIGLKDNIVYKDHVSSAASKILEGFTSVYSATVVERLLAEDAIIIGRLNCDEFAMGSANENSAYGPVKNPLDPTKVPGGSSGGSAAAVAANLCQVALGSDTGGSIRQPAAFCGLVGYKPTYGLVSRYGLIAYASSFDQIGPIAKSVEDAALILEVMAGFDPHDATSSKKAVPAFADFSASSERKKIGYITSCVENEGLDPEVRAHLTAEMERIKGLGHELIPIDFPYLDYLVPIYYLLTTAEASSNLARFDGIHFGYRSPNATDLESAYKKSRTEGFGAEVKRRIMLGTFVLSSGYYDAYYGKAQKARRLVKQKTLEALEKVDFLLTPTSPHTAFPLGQEIKDPTVMYLEDVFTVQANITGIPAVALPTWVHSNGLPFGIQLMGRPFEDDALLTFSREILNN